jgi:polyferredoxin
MFVILELMIAGSILFFGERFFKNFQGQTPRATTVKKWLVYFALVLILGLTLGRPWSLIWTFLPIIGLVGHWVWCFKHGIHPVTAEPRDRYYALRGWTSVQENNHET